jgi:uncharacterized protein
LIRLKLLGAVALASAALSGCGANGAAVESAARSVPLTIKSGAKVHKFTVEVMRTEAEQARGMMFRDKIAGEAGMLFPMNPPRVASFWMKNTLIPLDMIFIRSDGSIARIAAEAVPHSLEPVTSVEPVAAVLEIRGGRAGELGISENDKVEWPR